MAATPRSWWRELSKTNDVIGGADSRPDAARQAMRACCEFRCIDQHVTGVDLPVDASCDMEGQGTWTGPDVCALSLCSRLLQLVYQDARFNSIVEFSKRHPSVHI